VSDDWLDKFRDDRQKPKPDPDSSGPGWLERFRDDSNESSPRRGAQADRPPPPRNAPHQAPRRDAGRDFRQGSGSEPRNASPAQPAPLPRQRPMPRNVPPPGAPREGGAPKGATPKAMPQPRSRPSEAARQPQAHGLWGRPQDILIFVSLMALSLALGLSTTALALPRLMEIASPLEILLPDILVIAVTGGFVYLIAGLRQSWAIWLLIVFCIARFILYVPTFFHIDSVTVRMLTAMYFILQAAAFWFVFTPAAKRWLRAARK
jgi:hypothetical protein